MEKGLAIKILQNEIGKILNDAPRAIGVIGRDHFKENFIKGGFDDDGLTRWPKRQRETKNSVGRGVLIGKRGGRLKNSIRVISADTSQITWGTDVPYAKIHNEGGTITHPARAQVIHFNKKGRFSKVSGAYFGQKVNRRSYQIRMPQRQFIGPSKSLINKMDKWYTKRLNAALALIK